MFVRGVAPPEGAVGGGQEGPRGKEQEVKYGESEQGLTYFGELRNLSRDTQTVRDEIRIRCIFFIFFNAEIKQYFRHLSTYQNLMLTR